MIQHAKIDEITEILAITKACAQHMCNRGIYQWNEHYPNSAVFEKDVERSELYVLKKHKRILGTVVVSKFMDEEYIPIQWLTPDGNNSYIHRICVHPDQQGKGHAQRLMDFAENLSREKGCLSVRLDTFSQNPRNQRFYGQRGYQRLGNIYFPKQSKHPFYCYELVF
ncbi:MAG: GNAT family N-acetyltransferase [Bacteroidota bacterium]